MSIVVIEDRGPVRHIVMNRPEKRNALNRELTEALGEALGEAANDDSVRCLVLRGAGAMFSSGMDVSDLGALAGEPHRVREGRSVLLPAWNLCEEMTKPTIAQIHGGCIGGAMELALACDLRTMASAAVIGLVETRVGLVPDLGGCSRLPAVIGVGRAKEMIMTSKLIDGTEAERIGLVNRVAPEAELDEVTERLANDLLTCAPVAIGLAKRVIDAAAKPGLGQSLELEMSAQQICAASADFAAGTAALAEKRQPDFSVR